MAKLTEEQKRLNKEATSRRNRAFNQRKDAYRSERAAAEQVVTASPLCAAHTAAVAAREVLFEERDAAMARIQAQIQLMEDEKRRIENEMRARIEVASSVQRNAYTIMDEALRAARRDVDARYPDVKDCWSAGAWRPITEFMEPSK